MRVVYRDGSLHLSHKCPCHRIMRMLTAYVGSPDKLTQEKLTKNC